MAMYRVARLSDQSGHCR